MYRVVIVRGTFPTRDVAAYAAAEAVGKNPNGVISVRVEPSARALQHGEATVAEIMQMDLEVPSGRHGHQK